MSELIEPTLDEVVEALRDDPVLVPQMLGNGHTEEVREGFQELVEEADFPVYVVMVPQVADVTGEGAAREVATLLHDRLGGGDAVIAVHTTEADYYGTEVVSFGDATETTVADQLGYRYAPNGGVDFGLSEAGIIARELTVLVRDGDVDSAEWKSFAEQDPWRAPPNWDPVDDEPGVDGSTWFLAILVGTVVAGVAWILWGVAADRVAASRKAALARGPEPVQSTPAEVRAEAERELDAVADALAARAGTLGEDTRVRVDGSYDTARSLLERTGTAKADTGDLVGALVLARVARHALTSGAPGAEPWRPCFVDPRHGEGTQRRRVPVADRDLEVPVCADCADAGSLWPMRVPAGLPGRDQPWYEQDTVWSRTGYGAFVDDLWHPVAADPGTGAGTPEVER